MDMTGVTQIVLCCSPGITWNWYALVQINEDQTATVLCENRFHKFDYSRGSAMDDKLLEFARVHYQICESSTRPGNERIATGIKIEYRLYSLAEQVGRGDFPRDINVINAWLAYWEAAPE